MAEARKRDSKEEVLVAEIKNFQKDLNYDGIGYLQLNLFYNINGLIDKFSDDKILFQEELSRDNSVRAKIFFDNTIQVPGDRVSHFFSGFYEANTVRKNYAEYFLKNSIAEINRVKKDICEKYFFVENNKKSYLMKSIDDYLSKEVVQNPTYKGTCIEIKAEGYYTEINQFFERNYKNQNYISAKNRINSALNRDFYDGFARVIIALMMGSHIVKAFDRLFPNIIIENNSMNQNSAKLLDDYWKSYANVFELRQRAEAFLKENCADEVVYYVLGKLSAPQDSQKAIYLNKCLTNAEDKLKEVSLVTVREIYSKLFADAAFELFLLYINNGNMGEARKNLEIAILYENADACCIYGDLISKNKKGLHGDIVNKLDSISIEAESINAVEYYIKSKTGYGYFRAAKCMEASNYIEYTEDRILELYLNSYKCGYINAYDEIMKFRTRGNIAALYPAPAENDLVKDERVCVLLGFSEENIYFANTLPHNESWKILLVSDKCIVGSNIKTDVNKQVEIYEEADVIKVLNRLTLFNGGSQFRVLIVEYGQELQKTIRDSKKIFDYVEYKCREYENSKDIEPYHIENHMMYCVDFPQNLMELHIDRLQKDMGRHYIPVFNSNYNDITAKSLLFRYPLFAPLLSKKEVNSQFVLNMFGTGDTTVDLIKDIVALSVIEDKDMPIKLNVIGSKSTCVKARLLRECGQILRENNNLCKLKIEFYALDIESIEVQLLFSDEVLQNEFGNTEYTESEKWESLKRDVENTDYIICNGNEDLKNIELAEIINRYYVRTSNMIDKTPVICVQCKDEILSDEITNKRITDCYSLGYEWYEAPSWFMFGNRMKPYSYEMVSIEDNILYKWALAIHYSYYGKGVESNKVLNDYYTGTYGRDSSELAAIFMLYRLYAARCINQVKWDYDELMREIDDDSILKRYEKFIENPRNMELHSELEHIRWNRYMLSRNWMPSNASVMENYVKKGRGNVNQRLDIGKLHRYIATWKELGDCPGDKILFEVRVIRYELNEHIDCFLENEKLKDSILDILEKQISIISEYQKSNDKRIDLELQKEAAKKLGEIKQKLLNISNCEDLVETVEKSIQTLDSIDDTQYSGIQKQVVELSRRENRLKKDSIKENDRRIVSDMTRIIERSRSFLWRDNGLMMEDELEDRELK